MISSGSFFSFAVESVWEQCRREQGNDLTLTVRISDPFLAGTHTELRFCYWFFANIFVSLFQNNPEVQVPLLTVLIGTPSYPRSLSVHLAKHLSKIC